MSIKYIKNLDIKNKTVLLRVDVNEPIDEKSNLLDDFRIQAVLPTIKHLQEQNCTIVICSHLGRPDGKWDKHLSLKPIAQRLADLLELKFVEAEQGFPSFPAKHLFFYPADITEQKSQLQIHDLPPGNIVVLENLRFYKGEDRDDPFFAKQLAGWGEVYVNEAFSVSHRNAASIVAVTQYLPSYGGLLLEKEMRNLDYVLKQPQSPFVLMMGGIKMSDKIKALEHLAKRADKILLGGGLANILLEASGIEVGGSVIDPEDRRLGSQLLRNYKDKIVLPKDVVVANSSMSKSSIRAVPTYDIRKSETIFDIGPQTILEFATILKSAQTIVWNGPLGRFEVKPFYTGTMALAKVVGGVAGGRCFAVVGGGETVDAVRQAHQQEYIDHLSTGGGAMLDYLAGEKLPGIEALDK